MPSLSFIHRMSLLLPGLLLLAGCMPTKEGPEFAQGFAKLHKGLTPSEVRALLGSPTLESTDNKMYSKEMWEFSTNISLRLVAIQPTDFEFYDVEFNVRGQPSSYWVYYKPNEYFIKLIIKGGYLVGISPAIVNSNLPDFKSVHAKVQSEQP